MIFTRIRVGELSNLEPLEKIHVLPPCLIQPPPLKALLLVGEVMAGSGVWQDYQPLPTRTLHQCGWPHDGKQKPSPSLQGTLHSLHYYTSSPLSVHPHTWTVVYSFSHAQASFLFGLTQLGERSHLHCHSHFPQQRNPVCFNPYLGFGVNILPCTRFCVVVTHV